MSFRFCGGPLDLDQRLACGRELIELGERTGQEIFIGVGCQQLWWCYRELGDRAATEHWHAAAAQRVRWPDLEQLSQVACFAMLDGDLDRAERTLEEMDRIERGRDQYVSSKPSIIAAMRGWLPDPDRLRTRIESAPHDRWFLEALLARVLARTGRTAESRDLLDAARARAYAPRYAPLWWMTAISCLADAAAAASTSSAPATSLSCSSRSPAHGSMRASRCGTPSTGSAPSPSSPPMTLQRHSE